MQAGAEKSPLWCMLTAVKCKASGDAQVVVGLNRVANRLQASVLPRGVIELPQQSTPAEVD